MAVLQALADTHLRELPNRLWIVCEDAAAPNETVRHVLNASGVEHVYLARGPTRRKGHEQRSLAYEYIRRHRLAGVVYNMDDDNSYAHALWSELRMVRRGRVAVFTVQMDRHGFLERALYDAAGRFMGFDAGWCRAGGWSEIRLGPRFFCVDSMRRESNALVPPSICGSALCLAHRPRRLRSASCAPSPPQWAALPSHQSSSGRRLSPLRMAPPVVPRSREG